MSLYPLQFSPVLKDYPWGGRAIGEKLGRPIPSGPIAESWEISAHPDGATPVSSGPLAGRELEALMRDLGESLLGTANAPALERGRFPLLIKLLDAKEWLSVQVHPDDDVAMRRAGDLGKTEMWVVLDAEDDAEILLGVRRGVDADSFLEAVAQGTTADCLHRVPARPGDAFFVPPGTVHAIGPGILLAEIQQSSNVTYRVFDWNRTPARPLHVDDSLAVIDFGAVELGAVRPTRLERPEHELLAQCPHFRTERLRLEHGAEFAHHLDGTTFEIWGVLAGKATVESEAPDIELPAISWTLLPATLGAYAVRARQDTTLLRVFAAL